MHIRPRIPTIPDPNIFQAHHVGIQQLPGVTAFTFKYKSAHHYPPTSHRDRRDSPTLLHEWSQARYNTRTEPLWLSCVAKKEVGQMKRTVRSWVMRRMKVAFIESLRKKGFKADGTRLPGPGFGSLYGTAAIWVEAPALKAPFVELVKQTDVAVHKMLKFSHSVQIRKFGNTTPPRKQIPPREPGQRVIRRGNGFPSVTQDMKTNGNVFGSRISERETREPGQQTMKYQSVFSAAVQGAKTPGYVAPTKERTSRPARPEMTESKNREMSKWRALSGADPIIRTHRIIASTKTRILEEMKARRHEGTK